ncbi:MAG: methyltransferase domain-containing protein [Deltaproteobacteria bacterium]|nr:methyltransferase domain-containing protein [Deltaproteobacteria bacterium]
MIAGDVRDIKFPTESVDIVFINASYPNIADKKGAFTNIARTMKPRGRLVISHPMGKSFIDLLKERSPFPLDDFPERKDAETLLEPYGFRIEQFVDESELYFFLARKT